MDGAAASPAEGKSTIDFGFTVDPGRYPSRLPQTRAVDLTAGVQPDAIPFAATRASGGVRHQDGYGKPSVFHVIFLTESFTTNPLVENQV
ncbi:hypothetical protein NW759_004621 [Fusarium solani]|nr:hypothetical protein NW759_004621 [Fusarium solani]